MWACTPCPRYECWGGRSQALTSVLLVTYLPEARLTHKHTLTQSPPPPHPTLWSPWQLRRWGGVDDSLQWVREFSLGQKKRQWEKKRMKERGGEERGEGGRGKERTHAPTHTHIHTGEGWSSLQTEGQRKKERTAVTSFWSGVSAVLTPCPHLLHLVCNNSQRCAQTDPE